MIAPDLAISSLSVPGMERVVTGLRVRGVPQRVLAPRSVDDVLADLQVVGADLGVSAAGVCEEMRRERAALAAARGERRRRVLPQVVAASDVQPGGCVLQQ